MLEQELAQRAVLEALEGKIEALRGFGKLSEGTVLELVLWDDLSINFPTVFMAATKEEVALAISQATEKSNGRFTLQTLKPSIKKRSGIFYAATGVPESPTEEAPLLFWRVRYSEKHIPNNLSVDREHVFWLTSDALIYKPSNTVAIRFNKKDAINYKLLKYFAGHAGKTSRKEIAAEIHTTGENLSVEIAKLRKAVSRSIGISEKAFIVSKPGYGLGEHIKIEER
jgi:hypothetical protein